MASNAVRARRDGSTLLARLIQSYGLLILTVIMVSIFAVVNDNFLTLSNFQNIVEQNAALAIVAVGITFIIIAGMIDLSPGSVVALAGVIMAIVFTATGSLWLTLGAALLTCILVGAFNGSIIAWLGINPVIVTLAAYIWARGLALALTDKDSIVIQSPFIDFMNHRWLGLISPPMVLIVLVYLLGWFLLNKTRLGRYTYALGGDAVAAYQAGIPVNIYRVAIFVFSGFLVGLASVVTVSRMGAAQPNAVYGLELDAIAAVIIGGTSLSGGEGSIRQTIVGVLFLAILNNGLSTMGLRDASFLFYKGLVILLTLFFEVGSRALLRRASLQRTSFTPGAQV
jgi:ribose/xylose/arabinose/galactoside ABC-type transport system permease subunit